MCLSSLKKFSRSKIIFEKSMSDRLRDAFHFFLCNMQLSCFQLICLETCVIAILRYLCCFIFQSLLMAIGTAFLYNVDEFKIYSTYCANHSKAQKALHQSELLTSPYHL